MVCELFAFLPLSSPSVSRGVDDLVEAVVLMRGVAAGEVTPEGMVGGGEEEEAEERREGTSSGCAWVNSRLWAILIVVSSSGGGIASTSIPVGVAWKAGAEARSEEEAGGLWAPVDGERGVLHFAPADRGEGGGDEEEWVDESGCSSSSSSGE